MYIVQRRADGHYKKHGWGWSANLQDARTWATKNGTSRFIWTTDYSGTFPYPRTQVGDLIEVHYVVGPDPNAPPPPPPKAKRGRVTLNAPLPADDKPPEAWASLFGEVAP
jgi:hypothetical protein